MSSFGARRKAKVIVPSQDDEGNDGDSAGAGESAMIDAPKLFKSKNGRKPTRSSGLRKVINTDNDDETSGTNGDSNREEEDDGPAVVRPSISSRASAVKKARPKASSKLSFGADASEKDSEEDVTPVKKATLGKRTLEKNVFKNRSLPVRSMEEDDDRPRYDKEYLAELQSATPNTPQDVSALTIQDPDEMELDASELEGAMVVDTAGTSTARPSQQATTNILTEAEIREKKERRKRLAQEEGFLSVEDDVADPFAKKKKEESRLRTDEDELGEGFDDYVEDGGLSLGKRAVKERSKREKKEMAELINTAEGNESDSSADSDAERRIAYEAAQTRAGMDGLKKPKAKPGEDLLQVPQKITPLPVLSECLARLQASLQGMESEVQEKARRVQQLRDERDEIAKREGEVQALLDETGKKYQEAMGVSGAKTTGVEGAVNTNPELMGARGLESLGATPSRDVEMTE